MRGSAVVRAPWVCVVPRASLPWYPGLSPPGQTVLGRCTPLLDTEVGGAVRCQLSRVPPLVLLLLDLLHPESLVTTGNLAACVVGLQTSLVLDCTIRSIAGEKGKRNPHQPQGAKCFHRSHCKP